MDIKDLLEATYYKDASDLHLVDSHYPTLRIKGELQALITYPILTKDDIEEMVFSIITPAQKEMLLNSRELDFSTGLAVDANNQIRFRVNAYYQRGAITASLRLIPSNIKTFDELHLPAVVSNFAKIRQGFVLVTGGSNQGKSTTVASIINEINKNRKVHIVTIEDPVEFIFPKGKAIVSQREMLQDTYSWKNALRSVLREDSDIVYIGEMRDYETVSSALTIAETGHLVFSTLHTNSTAQTIDRIIDIFPENSKGQIRTQLSMVITGIITQRLVPSLALGRVPVCEILMGTISIKNSIREGKVHLIDNIIQTSKDTGMMLFEDHLKELVSKNVISHETALNFALRPDRYLQLMQSR